MAVSAALKPFMRIFLRVRLRLKRRKDSEHEMTLNRIILSTAFIVYLCAASIFHLDLSSTLGSVFSIFIIYNLGTFLIFAHILWKPEASRTRRLAAIPLDILFF